MTFEAVKARLASRTLESVGEAAVIRSPYERSQQHSMSQVTVLTGPERRRSSEEDQRRILAAAFASGAMVAAVARQYHVATIASARSFFSLALSPGRFSGAQVSALSLAVRTTTALTASPPRRAD